VLLAQINGHRAVYHTFDITHSNLPVQLSFPIHGAALFDWLDNNAPGTVATAAAGEPLPLSVPEGGSATVTMPDGSTRTLGPATATFTDTDQPGVYRLAYTGPDGDVVAGPTAVRTFVAAEAGAPVREIATAATGTAIDEPGYVVREWAPWVIGALLILLLTEWWVGHQRPTPGSPFRARRRAT
jgi:hypothetical protein